MKKFKAVAVVGARPQFVKAAALHAAWSRSTLSKRLSLVWAHTGQHYDYKMSKVFFDELNIPEPRYNLKVGSGSHGAQTALMLERLEDVFIKEKPDVVIVFGDTNSTLAGALAAAKLNVPVAHVEAGLRSGNRAMPEEVNRIATDGLSSLLFCPTEAAVGHLEREGVRKGVHRVGDVMADILRHYEHSIAARRASEPYYLATIHRNVNTDDPARLKRIFRALASLDRKVFMPLHPRTAKKLDAIHGLRLEVLKTGRIEIVEPLPYLKMLAAEKSAAGIVTDSGGVQKEAFLLGVPCVTLREETEWTETLAAGGNTLCEPDAKKIVAAFRKLSKRGRRTGKLYGRGDASEQILKEIVRFLDRGGKS